MAPFDCPNSILNTRVTHARRFATQQYSLERLKILASATDSSLNDIVPLGDSTWISISEVKPNSPLIGSTTAEPSQAKDDITDFIPFNELTNDEVVYVAEDPF